MLDMYDNELFILFSFVVHRKSKEQKDCGINNLANNAKTKDYFFSAFIVLVMSMFYHKIFSLKSFNWL